MQMMKTFLSPQIVERLIFKELIPNRDSISFPIGSPVAIQRHDSGPWMHGVVVNSHSADHNSGHTK